MGVLYHLFKSCTSFSAPSLHVSRHGEHKCGGVAEVVENFIRFYLKPELPVQ